jgi:cephalosporin-C deacetylase
MCSVVRPPDFDAFWANTLAEAERIPLNPSAEYVELRSTEDVAVYDIGYDSLDGVRIAGWYCVPTASFAPPPYPGLLIVPGYIAEPT